MSINADEMRSIVESLESIENEASCFGVLTTAEVKAVADGGDVVICTYADSEWRIIVENHNHN